MPDPSAVRHRVQWCAQGRQVGDGFRCTPGPDVPQHGAVHTARGGKEAPVRTELQVHHRQQRFDPAFEADRIPSHAPHRHVAVVVDDGHDLAGRVQGQRLCAVAGPGHEAQLFESAGLRHVPDGDLAGRIRGGHQRRPVRGGCHPVNRLAERLDRVRTGRVDDVPRHSRLAGGHQRVAVRGESQIADGRKNRDPGEPLRPGAVGHVPEGQVVVDVVVVTLLAQAAHGEDPPVRTEPHRGPGSLGQGAQLHRAASVRHIPQHRRSRNPRVEPSGLNVSDW